MSSCKSLQQPKLWTTQPSRKRVIHDSVTSFLTFSSECFSDDSRGLFDGLRCEKTVGIAPVFSVALGFQSRISAFKSLSYVPQSNSSQLSPKTLRFLDENCRSRKKITEICSIIYKCTIHGEKNYMNLDFSSPLKDKKIR